MLDGKARMSLGGLAERPGARGRRGLGVLVGAARSCAPEGAD